MQRSAVFIGGFVGLLGGKGERSFGILEFGTVKQFIDFSEAVVSCLGVVGSPLVFCQSSVGRVPIGKVSDGGGWFGGKSVTGSGGGGVSGKGTATVSTEFFDASVAVREFFADRASLFYSSRYCAA